METERCSKCGHERWSDKNLPLYERRATPCPKCGAFDTYLNDIPGPAGTGPRKQTNESKATASLHRAQADSRTIIACPLCAQKLRVPAGREDGTVSCPKCGKSFGVSCSKKRGRIEESPQQDKRHTSFWKKLFGGGKKPGTAFNTGCLSCGSERKLAMVSLQELNKDSHFSGTLLLCSSCGRIFCDSSVILEDQRTLQPLRTLVEGSMQHHHVSLPRVAFVSANPFPPRTTIYQCILGRPFHSEVGMEFIESILLFCILVPNMLKHRKITERLSIEIDGYSEDKREIWQIPELTSFFYMMHKQIQFPAIEFWLTPDSLKLFLKTAAAGIPQEEKREILQMSAAINAVMKEHNLRSVRGSKEGVSDEAQLVRWLMVESSSKTEAFLKNGLKGKDDVVRSIQAESELCKALVGSFA